MRQLGFLEVVKESWERPALSHNKARTLHIKLSRFAKALKAWGHSWVDELKQQAALAEQSELQLDQLQEQRQLSQDEISLRKLAKDRILGMAVLRRVKIRQRSRLTTMRVGDANSRLFHLHATSRRRKNHIPALVHMGTTYTAQKQKASVLHSHFSAVLGTTTQRVQTLNWEVLQVQPHDLSSLNIDITVEEIRKVVMSAPPEKALGAEGYIGGFIKVAWDIIKHDLVEVIQEIFEGRARCWNLLNSANITLLWQASGGVAAWLKCSVQSGSAVVGKICRRHCCCGQ